MSIGAHEPFWLEAPGRRLYAALHPATPLRPSAGVVMVPPLFHEQARSRRFITEVASGLAAAGLPCLRFDYAGTGDSSGSGDALDFASMHRDLDLAVAGLFSRARVDRIVLLAWRGAALVTQSWLQQGRDVDLVMLWEPIVDGSQWLAELEGEDTEERACRPRPRPGLRRTDTSGDGQLMGCAAPQQLRTDLARAVLTERVRTVKSQTPVWAVLRGDAMELPIDLAHVQSLPAGAPTFGSGASMEAMFFLSPALERVVDGLGRALVETLAAMPAVATMERTFR